MNTHFHVSCEGALWLITQGGVGEPEPCGPGALHPAAAPASGWGRERSPPLQSGGERETTQAYTVEWASGSQRQRFSSSAPTTVLSTRSF